jgi:hypothetical protein
MKSVPYGLESLECFNSWVRASIREILSERERERWTMRVMSDGVRVREFEFVWWRLGFAIGYEREWEWERKQRSDREWKRDERVRERWWSESLRVSTLLFILQITTNLIKRRNKRIYKYLIFFFLIICKKKIFMWRFWWMLIIGLQFGFYSNRYSDQIFFEFELQIIVSNSVSIIK